MRRLLSIFIAFSFTFFVGKAQTIEQILPFITAKNAAGKFIYWNLDSMYFYRYYDGSKYLFLRTVTVTKNSLGQSISYFIYGRSDTLHSIALWDSIHFTYNRSEPLEIVKFPLINNNWGDTNYCIKYDLDGKKIFYLNHQFDRSSNSWDNGSKYYYSYNDQSLLEQTLTYEIYGSDEWFLAHKTSYNYNDTLLNYSIKYNWDSNSGSWKPYFKKVYSYSYISSANAYVVDTVISYDFPSGSTTWQKYRLDKFIYTSSLKVLEHYIKLWDDNIYDWVNNLKYIYDYDSQDRVTELTFYRYNTDDNSWSPVYKRIYAYTDQGLLDSVIYYSWYNGNWEPVKYEKNFYNNANVNTEKRYYYYNSKTSQWSLIIQYLYYYSQYSISGTEQIPYVSLQIAPNPTTGIIKLNTGTKNSILQVLTLSGQVVFSKKLLGQENTVNLTFLPADTYIIKIISSDGKILTGKFVKL